MTTKKFVYYKNGEIELVEKDQEGNIVKYIAHWYNKSELNASLEDE